MGTAELLLGVEECTGKLRIGQCIWLKGPLGGGPALVPVK